MNLRATAILAAAFLLAACGSNDEPAAATEAETPDAGTTLHALFDEYSVRYLDLNPLAATFIGVEGYNDRMANSWGPEHIEATTAFNEELLQRLLEIDRVNSRMTTRLATTYSVSIVRRSSRAISSRATCSR